MDSADVPFYKDGLRFACQRCSRCCGTSPGFVYLSRRDVQALCSYLRLSVRELVQRYCRWADYYGGTTVLALRERANHDCILWEGGCSAYPARPVQCETWPFWSWVVAERSAWNECARDCPGMNRGRLWSAAEIAERSRRTEENAPLFRAEVEALLE